MDRHSTPETVYSRSGRKLKSNVRIFGREFETSFNSPKSTKTERSSASILTDATNSLISPRVKRRLTYDVDDLEASENFRKKLKLDGSDSAYSEGSASDNVNSNADLTSELDDKENVPKMANEPTDEFEFSKTTFYQNTLKSSLKQLDSSSAAAQSPSTSLIVSKVWNKLDLTRANIQMMASSNYYWTDLLDESMPSTDPVTDLTESEINFLLDEIAKLENTELFNAIIGSNMCKSNES